MPGPHQPDKLNFMRWELLSVRIQDQLNPNYIKVIQTVDPETQGRLFCGSIKNGQSLAKGKNFRHQLHTWRNE
jgi:hypothetical protein